MDMFLAAFYGLAVVCVALYAVTRAALPAAPDPAFQSFQRTYLAVYLLAMSKSHIY